MPLGRLYASTRSSKIICQIFGLGSEDGPLGKEAAKTRLSNPGRAKWSMPAMPYISPAAIGWRVVRFFGEPNFAKCSPIACNVASGQPSPLEELTVTTASSGIRVPTSSKEISLERGITGDDQ